MKNFTYFIKAIIPAIVLLLFSIDSYSQTTFYSDDTYTVPSGVTQIKVQAWGAGGGGSDKSGNGSDGGNGGGGGGFRSGILTVTPGDNISITIGTGGNGATNISGNDGFNGTNTIITHSSGTITANGGAGGVVGDTAGGPAAAGGTGSFTGTVTSQDTFTGGNGGIGNTQRGGGGGGGAGSNGNGNAGTNSSGGSGGNGNGGNGGSAGNRGNGGNGSTYGGGGGASGDGTGVGGKGANGLAIISLVAPEIDVKGNGASIANGDIYPSTFNNTNFGSVNIGNTSTKTYTIYNTGSVALNISNITLSNTTDFQIVGTAYNPTVNSGGDTQFQIKYTGSSGKHSATVTIESDDADEGTYTFVIRGSSKATGDTGLWSVTNITSNYGLDNPYEITYGPDGFLWVTEKRNGKLVKVSPADGINSKTEILDLSSLFYETDSQDGLLGFAFHPDCYNSGTENYIYIAYTYNAGGGTRNLRIARYNYNAGTIDSGSAYTLIEGLDASYDHNSARMKIGPDLKLYYTIGDQGANQFNNACKPIRAQDLPTSPSDYGAYKGKVLRLNLDGSIPDGTDGESANPTLDGVRSHVYTYGHRNPQGIIFGSNGKLYASEHGAKVDDELNIITAGKNYGWPHIAGYYDNNAYGYCNWSSTPGGCSSVGFTDHNCPSGVDSVYEFDPVNADILPNFQPPIGTYDSTTNYDPSGDWLTWPTVAPSSIDIYEAGLIPNWGQSLLITTLKEGTIFRAKLNAAGDALVDITTDNQFEEFHSSNDRYRDIAMDPDGVTFYAITDSKGTTSGPSGNSSISLSNPGVIMKFKYIGPAPTTTTYYVDADGDTFGDINDTVGTEFESAPGTGYSLTNDDCDDADADEFPGQTWYLDADGDGYSEGTSTTACNRPTDYYIASELTATSGDCDDSNANINPGETETPGNGIDDDCNATTPDGTLQLDNLNLENISLSPNPFNHNINIQLPISLNNSEFVIKVFDLNGRLVFNKNYVNNNGSIKVSGLNNLEQAPYLIKITSKQTGKSIIKKLIKY
tara:strand:- start:67070 stop:70153 length:3084 start_codon:yes stop_codon:yes gene_type:complete